MSTVGYTAVAHILLYGAAAVALYVGLRRSVLRGRMPAFTACVSYLLALALLPSLLMQALGALADYLFASELVASEAVWDVGLAMTLFFSTWVCYSVGVLAACLGCWSFFKTAPNAT